MRSLAELLFNRLDKNRKLYIELGNKIWNWAPPYVNGRNYALEQANLRWPDVEGEIRQWNGGDPVWPDMMVFSWQGVRTAEMGAIFREVFRNQENRLVVVAAGQIGASGRYWHPSRYLLETPVYVHEEGGKRGAEIQGNDG